MTKTSDEDNEAFYQKLVKDCVPGGYHLNPDKDFVMDLVEGLLVNKSRYGYPSCPCRLSTGKKEDDLDIVCPCDYRDIDLDEFGACYCGLYVSRDVSDGKKKLKSIPERRGKKERTGTMDNKELPKEPGKLKYPVYRCKVCGYLCAREHPPETCPVCKATKDRFERFI